MNVPRKKRNNGSADKPGSVPSKHKAPSSNSVLSKTFEVYRDELDNKHDRYERLVKASRDLTIVSKRIIFLLHRHPTFGRGDFSEELEKKLDDCRDLLKTIVKEVAEEDVNRYQRAFSPGLQEFVEAISFLHFQKHGDIIPYKSVCDDYMQVDPSGTKEVKVLNHLDYVLGIGDLTGELMKMCINSIGAGDHETAKNLCNVLRKVYDQLVVFHVTGEFSKKMNTLRGSLRKVENACYQLHVRGSEMPEHLLVDIVLGDNGNSEMT